MPSSISETGRFAGKKKKPFRISCNPQLTVLEMHIRAVAERIAARSHL